MEEDILREIDNAASNTFRELENLLGSISKSCREIIKCATNLREGDIQDVGHVEKCIGELNAQRLKLEGKKENIGRLNADIDELKRKMTI